MIDYFALLDQPKRPWLDPEELKRIFHEKTLRAHPDAQPRNDESSHAETAFTDLNEGYQVLRDTKRRLHHLLTLEGVPPSSQSAAIPADLEELFPVVAVLTQEADDLVQQTHRATNALSRSLLSSELSKLQERLGETLEKVSLLHWRAEAELKALGEKWRGCFVELQTLYLRFSYLTRWIAELRERQLTLETGP